MPINHRNIHWHCEFVWKLPKSHRKIQSDGNHPKSHKFSASRLQKQYKVILCVCQISTCTSSQTFWWAMIQTFFLLAKAESTVYPSYIIFWFTVAYCLQSFLLSLLTRSTERIFVIQVVFLFLFFCFFVFVFLFLFFYGAKLKIFFSNVLFSPREKNRDDRYLWRWIIKSVIKLNEKQK